MSTLSKKSPAHGDSLKAKKSESFVDKLTGTLGRKKKQQLQEQPEGSLNEFEQMEKEAREALEHACIPPLAKDIMIEEGETRRFLHRDSKSDPKLVELINLLKYWLNEEMAEERIVVREVQEDLYDGQIIQRLVERLASIKIEVSEIAQSEEEQRKKLNTVIGTINRYLQLSGNDIKWTPELIHVKDLVAILHLLIAIALHFRAPIRLPDHVTAKMIVMSKLGGKLRTENISEQLTTHQTELGLKGERDAFDTLFDYGPDKLAHVKSSLLAFCNKHLNKINLEVTDLDNQFQDGVNLILMMGLLEGYFVPLHAFHLQTKSFDEKLKNVSFAYKLMEEAGFAKPRSRVQDIANGDVKLLAMLKERREMNRYSHSNRRKHKKMSSTLGRRPSRDGQNDTLRSKKSESFMDKLSGTLTRKKKPQPEQQNEVDEENEGEEVELEGRNAINSAIIPYLAKDIDIDEGETRRFLTRDSNSDPKMSDLINLLVYWLNQELADERIVVRNVQEDLYDGQIIQRLIEKLAGIRIEVPEVTQSEEGQRNKLETVIATVNRHVAPSQIAQPMWTAEQIHAGDLVAMLHLLVAMALHFRAPIRMPENVVAKIVTVNRTNGHVRTENHTEQLTTTQTELGLKGERDAFDTLFDYGPDKLAHVKSSLLAFCNKHLNKINLEVNDLDSQFQDGVFLVLLMGLLEGYFVPLHAFHLQVTSYEEKVKNIVFAFKLMEEAGLSKPRSRPQDIANGDVKSTLRLLHLLFTKYKHV